MKTRWSYSWLLAGLVGANLPFAIYRTAIGTRGPLAIGVLGLVLLFGSLIAALSAGSHLGARDERESGIAARATALSLQWAMGVAMVTTILLPFLVTEPTVPLRWLADALVLFLMTQLGIRWGAEALMLGRPE